MYRRLSNLSKKVEFEGFAAELIDRFGKIPPEVNTLLLVVRIKSVCKKAGIGKLDGGPKGATLQFHNDKFISPEGLVEFIKKQNGLAKIKDNKLIIKREWKKIQINLKEHSLSLGTWPKLQFLMKKIPPLKINISIFRYTIIEYFQSDAF